MPRRRHSPPRCPKPAFWPEPDRKRWQVAQHKGDILEPRVAGSAWAPHTRSRIETGYGRWLSWLLAGGHLDPSVSPGASVTRERLASYVTALQAINAPNTVLGRIQELRLALCVIAPERGWIWIRDLECRLRQMANAARNRRAGVVSSEKLFNPGLALMAEAEAATTVASVMRAVQFRDGLMIALLAARPLRRHNFAAIEIGPHLVRAGDAYWINFAASETKTRAPIEVPFPAALVPHLERYLSVYRPLLAGCDGYWKGRRASMGAASALWLSQQGTAMAEVAMSDRFRKLTRGRLGKPVTMHRFRDSAAASIATEDPEHVLITKSILGHTTLRSSERYYNHASSLQAVRRYQASILGLRQDFAAETKTGRVKAQARARSGLMP